MTPFARDSIERFLHALATMGDRSAQYVLDHGEWFEWSGPPDRYGEAKNCFRNCANEALWNDEWTYCEGYAVTPSLGFPAEHAWLVNAAGEVKDVTWRHKGTECGFCLGNGVIEHEWDDEDEDATDVPCNWCDGTGQVDEHHDMTGTVYFGVRVDDQRLAEILQAKRTYGVLEVLAADGGLCPQAS